MEVILVENNKVSPLYDDWEDTKQKFQDRITKIPAVESGAIPLSRAEAWLETASKIHPPSAVNRLIHQVSGLGAKDMRTIIAVERGEYFPNDSAGELYDRKLLKSLIAPNGPSLERERILTNITRAMLLKHYGLERNTEMERSMSVTDPARKALWLIGNPGMVGTNGNDNFLFDIQQSKEIDEVDQGDLIRLHYYDLVANNSGLHPKHLSLVKVNIDPVFADSLISMARLSKEAEQSIYAMAGDFFELSNDKINIKVHEIERQPELYREVITSGQKHWQQMQAGNIPHIKIDPPMRLDDEKEALYIDKAKQFLAATQTYKAADAARKEAVSEFVESMKDVDISDNLQPPYQGALLRKYDNFRAEEAATYMEKHLNIDPAHLRNREINTDSLKQAFIRMGGDVSPYYEYGAPDKKAIKTSAEQIGFDLSAFYTREMRAIVNPKTRGPIHDAIIGIRSSITEPIKALNHQTANSMDMNNHNLLPSNTPTIRPSVRMNK